MKGWMDGEKEGKREEEDEGNVGMEGKEYIYIAKSANRRNVYTVFH